MNGVRISTIENLSGITTSTFQDMYQYYTSPELHKNKAEFRRFPCNCAICDENITEPWKGRLNIKNQLYFEKQKNCYF